jgi:hypothetical protein
VVWALSGCISDVQSIVFSYREEFSPSPMEGKSVGITSSWYCSLLTSFPLQYTVAYLGPTRFVVRGVVGHGSVDGLPFHVYILMNRSELSHR